jgi:hypothetical protein
MMAGFFGHNSLHISNLPYSADVVTGIELEAMFGAITGICFFCSSKLGCVTAKELLRFDSSIA